MKTMIAISMAWLIMITVASAALLVTVAVPKNTGSKAIIGLELQNTYSQKIKSARAVAFLFNDQGKVVGQDTQWIIGGPKSADLLAPNANAKYNFVVNVDKPFTKAQLVVTRLILEDGKLADVQKDVQIKDLSK